jgi:hypothetical protein
MTLLSKTLLALQADRLNIDLENLLDECLQYLLDRKIILAKDNEQESDADGTSQRARCVYETTKLGKATVEGEFARVRNVCHHIVMFRQYRFGIS